MRTVRILYICICRLLTQAFPFAVPIAGAPDEWADEEAGIEAVQRILDCLDDIYSLQDAHVDADVLRDMLRDGRLQQFLQLFDRISSSVITTNGRAPTAEAVARSRDVLELLSSVGVGVGNKYAKDELMQLLAAPHLQVSLPPPPLILYCICIYYVCIYNVYMYLWLYFVASCVRALKHMIVHIVTALWSYQSVVERMRAPCSARFSISQNKFEMYLVPANRQLPKLDKQTAPALLTSHRHRPRPLSRQSLILRPNCDTHIPRRDTHRENVYKQTAPANATKIQTI